MRGVPRVSKAAVLGLIALLVIWMMHANEIGAFP